MGSDDDGPEIWVVEATADMEANQDVMKQALKDALASPEPISLLLVAVTSAGSSGRGTLGRSERAGFNASLHVSVASSHKSRG